MACALPPVHNACCFMHRGVGCGGDVFPPQFLCIFPTCVHPFSTCSQHVFHCFVYLIYCSTFPTWFPHLSHIGSTRVPHAFLFVLLSSPHAFHSFQHVFHMFIYFHKCCHMVFYLTLRSVSRSWSLWLYLCFEFVCICICN